MWYVSITAIQFDIWKMFSITKVKTSHLTCMCESVRECEIEYKLLKDLLHLLTMTTGITSMDNDVKILSMNVRGLFSNKKKRLDIFNWVKTKNPTIVCLQETHSTEEVMRTWENEWGGTAYFSNCTSKSAGVCILFRNTLDFKVNNIAIDCNGRYIVVDLSLQEQRLTLVCLYGYNTDEPQFFHEIMQKITVFKNNSVILCGDWNFVQDKSLDTYNIVLDRHSKSHDKVQELIENFDLVDPWRICYPTEKQFTWRQHTPVKQSRIDYFLVSEDLYSVMRKTKIIPGYKTDHSATVFDFSVSNTVRGKGYWKFNAQLLKDVEYINLVKSCITETINEYLVSGDTSDRLNIQLSCNDQLFWEILKVKIRSLSISYSIKRSKENSKLAKNLEEDIQKLEDCYTKNPNNYNKTLLEGKKCELEKYRENFVEGFLLRSRANWHESGEKCTNFFCSLEKKNYVNKTISELIDDSGKHISKQSDILKTQENFLQKIIHFKI